MTAALEYVPGKTRPGLMTDSEITRELRNDDTTRERRKQLLDHLAWLREYRRKPAGQVPEIPAYDTGLTIGPPDHCHMPDCGHFEGKVFVCDEGNGNCYN